VHVGGLAGGRARHHLGFLGVGTEPEEAVLAAGAELGGVVEHPAVGAVEVRMGGGQLAGDVVGDPGGGERLGVELDRDRGLGHGDEALAEARQVDVAVVRELGREDRCQA
jgi:hypothetical protein